MTTTGWKDRTAPLESGIPRPPGSRNHRRHNRAPSADLTELVVVAIDATKEITKHALEWALSNVVQPGDHITLLALLPATVSGKKASPSVQLASSNSIKVQVGKLLALIRQNTRVAKCAAALLPCARSAVPRRLAMRRHRYRRLRQIFLHHRRRSRALAPFLISENVLRCRNGSVVQELVWTLLWVSW